MNTIEGKSFTHEVKGKLEPIRRPILAVDFDGVIHSYEKGWHDGTIYGSVMPYFFQWLVEAEKHFTIVIVSSRLHNINGSQEINDWLHEHWAHAVEHGEVEGSMPPIAFSTTRPPAWVTIDDRALTFKGDWFASELAPEALLAFKTWQQS